jgi:hypothetical protein
LKEAIVGLLDVLERKGLVDVANDLRETAKGFMKFKERWMGRKANESVGGGSNLLALTFRDLHWDEIDPNPQQNLSWSKEMLLEVKLVVALTQSTVLLLATSQALKV